MGSVGGSESKGSANTKESCGFDNAEQSATFQFISQTLFYCRCFDLTRATFLSPSNILTVVNLLLKQSNEVAAYVCVPLAYICKSRSRVTI